MSTVNKINIGGNSVEVEDSIARNKVTNINNKNYVLEAGETPYQSTAYLQFDGQYISSADNKTYIIEISPRDTGNVTYSRFLVHGSTIYALEKYNDTNTLSPNIEFDTNNSRLFLRPYARLTLRYAYNVLIKRFY